MGSPTHQVLRVRLEGAVDEVWYSKEAAFTKDVAINNRWQTTELEWDAFKQSSAICPGPKCIPAFRPTGVMSLGWELSPSPAAPDFWLDNIQLLY